jgi:hypothetical protein
MRSSLLLLVGAGNKEKRKRKKEMVKGVWVVDDPFGQQIDDGQCSTHVETEIFLLKTENDIVCNKDTTHSTYDAVSHFSHKC